MRVDAVDDAAKALEKHVKELSHNIGERNWFRYDALNKARDYIAARFREQDLPVEVREYIVDGKACHNVIADLPGRDPKTKDRIILVGAHYDTVRGTPGADDNASGVALLLELGRALRSEALGRTVRLAAFSTEEPPFFGSKSMGSAVYAEAARANGEKIDAMLCLEMVGFYTSAAGSQSYPPGLEEEYPSVGNFIAIAGDNQSAEIVASIGREMKAHSSLPALAVMVPRETPGVALSDHLNFWEAGFPAVLVTDTAFYRNDRYHTRRDTYRTLDYSAMGELLRGMTAAIKSLAGEGK